jgi:hypothetical protein
MKNLLFICSLLLSTVLFAQKSTEQTTYTGKIGISKIEFYHAWDPGESTAKITTGKSIAAFSNCAEDVKPKVQKLCLFDSKEGFNVKRNIKINLQSGAKKLPKTITGTYFVNGEPVNFKLVKSS